MHFTGYVPFGTPIVSLQFACKKKKAQSAYQRPHRQSKYEGKKPIIMLVPVLTHPNPLSMRGVGICIEFLKSVINLCFYR